MSSVDNGGHHKESLMDTINDLFAPPVGETYEKMSSIGQLSARRQRKACDSIPTPENASPESTTEQLTFADPYSRSEVSGRDDPFWRKPRANCHEFCDSCGCTEGERLVCDRCPASFHLECLDPPLDSEEAPIGVWFCHRCSMILKDEDHTSTSSDQSGQPSSESSTTRTRVSRGGPSMMNINNNSISVTVCGGNGTRRAGTRSVFNERSFYGHSSRSSTWGESAYVADMDESELGTLWSVIKYACYQNPKEFDLPKDLLPGIKIPGTYKTLSERKGKGILEPENGFLPRPERRCFFCARTCLTAPLLPCDYCANCFHLDCLDPPLSQFPPRSDRWMCPLHTEHTIDRYLVRSIRLTERIHAWDSVSSANVVDPHRFFPVQPINDDNSSDLKRPRLLDSVAPHELTYGPDEEAVIFADLMRAVQRGRAEKVANAVAESLVYERLDQGINMEATERSTWELSAQTGPGVIDLCRQQCQMRIVVPEAVKAAYSKGLTDMSMIPRRTAEQPCFNKLDHLAFIAGLTESQSLSKIDDDSPMVEEPIKPTGDFLKEPGTTDQCVSKPHPSDSKFDKPSGDDKEHLPSSLIGITQSALKGVNQSNMDEMTKLAKYDMNLVLSLAAHRFAELTRHQLQSRSRDQFRDGLDLQTETLPCSQIRARAVLVPCAGTVGPVVPMRYRSLSIGTSPACHVCLSKYRGPSGVMCRSVSQHHADLFFDEWTNHHELLNYSEFGCIVDGISYCNDVTSKRVYQPKSSNLLTRVRELLNSPKNQSMDNHNTNANASILSPSLNSRLCMAGTLHEDTLDTDSYCDCAYEHDLKYHPTKGENGDVSKQGWEGSALLRNGSVMRIGCLQFVFSLVDHALPSGKLSNIEAVTSNTSVSTPSPVAKVDASIITELDVAPNVVEASG